MAHTSAYSTPRPRVFSTNSKCLIFDLALRSDYWQAREYAQAKDLLSRHGAKVVDVYIIPPEQYMVGDINVDDMMDLVIG